MFINSIKVKNVLSFGPDRQELNGLKTMNLLIGPNGSGKTNILRLLGDFDYEIRPTNSPQVIQSVHPISGKTIPNTVRAVNSYLIEIGDTFISSRLNHPFQYTADIEIEYLNKVSHDKKASINKIRFKNRELVVGDIKALGGVKFIKSDWSDAAFIKSIGHVDDPFEKHLILNVGLRYIFKKQYSVLWGGSFGNQFTRTDCGRYSSGQTNDQTFKANKWPSGVLNVAKIIRQISSVRNTVFLLEEPELHLEPRVIRRMVEFLRWFSTPDEELANAPELENRINREWLSHFENLQADRPNKEIKQTKRTKRQFFISSHSPVLINEFFKMGSEQAQVFELRTDWIDTDWQPDVEGATLQKQKTLFTYVRSIKNDAHTILDSLGASGADILQCNGIIWVEGPSDAIYLKNWLDMYARNNSLPQLIQGSNFEFQMYGGALLDSLCLMKGEEESTFEKRKLIEMFSFSRNAYVVMDSDAVIRPDNEIYDQSNFKAAKLFIKNQIFNMNQKGYKLGLWFSEGNTELRTIEDYLDHSSLDTVASGRKKIEAQKRVAKWGNKKIGDFDSPLSNEIKMLYEQISEWQI